MMAQVKRVLVVISVSLLGLAAAPGAGALPKEAVTSAGLCVVVPASDSKELAALAGGGRVLVHGLAADEAAVARAREAIEAAGPYGRVSAVRWAGGRALPYADNLVNCLLLDADALGDEAPPAAEALRVLAPDGVAWVKRGGKWERTVKPAAKNADGWTHFYHDAGGNPVSIDEQVGPPTGLQWVAGVAGEGADPTTGYRLGEGRAVYEWRAPAGGRKGAISSWLVCRDAYSGVLLWAKLTGVGVYKTKPVVLADGRVFAFLDADRPAVALDAVTGELLTTFDQGGRPGKVRQGGRVDVNLVWHDGNLIQTAGDTVYVLDGRTGALKWKSTGAAGAVMDYPTVMAPTGQLFVTNGTTGRDVGRYPGTDVREVIAFDLKTGREQWRRGLEKDGRGRELSQLSVSEGRLFAFNLSGFIGRARKMFIARLDPKDGTPLWTVEPATRSQLLDMAVVGKRIYVMSLGVLVFDTETGKQVGKYDIPGNSRCDMSRASDKYLLMSFGNFVDLGSDPLQLYRSEISRSTCGGGSTPGYGMMFYTPNRCQCFESVRGFLAVSREPTREAVADERRLERGPAGATNPVAPAVAPAADEWPTYMGNPMRGGSNGTTLPAEPKLLWKVRLTSPPQGPAAKDLALTSNYNGAITAATIAGGKAFVAAPESHRVIAVDAGTGKEAWSFTAGGRVDTPPTIHEGLCLCGCRDGWVYALDAATGRLAWRFLAAPYERYMVAFDGVESTWPLHGSVMVKDGVAVVAAGYHPETNGGIFVYGLEPHTGRMLWKVQVGHDRKPGPLGGKIPDDGLTTRAYGYNANAVLNELLTTDGTWVAMRGMSFDARTGKIGETVVAAKNGAARAVQKRVSPLTTTLSFGMRSPYRNQELENYGGPGPGAGAWSLRVEGDDPKQPKVEVGGEIIAFNAERVVANGIGDFELGVWDRTGGRPAVARYNSRVAADELVPRDSFKDAATKAVILAGDKIALAVNRPAAKDQPRRGEVSLYAAKDAAPLGKFSLDAGVIQTGLAAANGRLYVACEDGTLACFGQ